MQIWVDADACPVVIKDILCRAAQRRAIITTFVANQHISLPRSEYIQSIKVSSGFDVADNRIISLVTAGDLVISADIPLAAQVIELGASALNPRGELYSSSTIKSLVNMRDFMDSLRGSGIQTGGPPPLSQKDRQNFANHLDSWLTQNHH